MTVAIVPTLVKIHNQDSNHNIRIEAGCDMMLIAEIAKMILIRINTNYIITITKPFGE